MKAFVQCLAHFRKCLVPLNLHQVGRGVSLYSLLRGGGFLCPAFPLVFPIETKGLLTSHYPSPFRASYNRKAEVLFSSLLNNHCLLNSLVC